MWWSFRVRRVIGWLEMNMQECRIAFVENGWFWSFRAFSHLFLSIFNKGYKIKVFSHLGFISTSHSQKLPKINGNIKNAHIECVYHWGAWQDFDIKTTLMDKFSVIFTVLSNNQLRCTHNLTTKQSRKYIVP